MGYGGGGTIPDGLNVVANHDAIVKGLTASLPTAAKLGVPNLITFFGNRRGMSDAEATKNCIAGLNRIEGPGRRRGRHHRASSCSTARSTTRTTRATARPSASRS